MKDMKEPNMQPAGTGDKKGRIVDLTPDMELRDEARGKIIDLTTARQGPAGDPEPKPKAPSSIPDPTPDSAEPSSAEQVFGTAAGIEADIDAAFDAIQEKRPDEQPPSIKDDPAVADGDLDLAEGLEGLTMADTIPLPPASESAATGIEYDEGNEPALALFPDPSEDIADDAALEMQERVTPPPSVAPATETSFPEGLEAELKDVDVDDTIELIDVVVPIDLIPLEESSAASGDTAEEPHADSASADADETSKQGILSMAEEDEEDVIDLTDVAEPAALAEAEPWGATVAPDAQDEEDDVIELVEIVDPETLAMYQDDVETIEASPAADDDDVIELTDIVYPEALAADSQQAAESEDEEEPVIELTDKIFQPETPDERAAEEVPAYASSQAGDQVIRLDSVLAHVRQNKTKIEEELSHGIAAEFADGPSTFAQEDDGIDIKEVREALGGPTELTDKELEEAIERIIRTKYAKTIERHIAAAVEKVVTREIESIKRSLMEDQDPDD